ncbi:MAG: hypothetical protein KGJ57_00160 [Sphingomonadales bacterium]|nr:hypothetical protein [Sphingomonadales bacterium]MDE2167820.1 hypothetical protein [Sphingomonadales bacterium]
MRRSLVLGDETARHPFLKSLPPHVRGGGQPIMRAVLPEPRPSMLRRAAGALVLGGQALRQRWRQLDLTASDLRLFLMAYCACFLAVSVFIW